MYYDYGMSNTNLTMKVSLNFDLTVRVALIS